MSPHIRVIIGHHRDRTRNIHSIFIFDHHLNQCHMGAKLASGLGSHWHCELDTGFGRGVLNSHLLVLSHWRFNYLFPLVCRHDDDINWTQVTLIIVPCTDLSLLYLNGMPEKPEVSVPRPAKKFSKAFSLLTSTRPFLSHLDGIMTSTKIFFNNTDGPPMTPNPFYPSNAENKRGIGRARTCEYSRIYFKVSSSKSTPKIILSKLDDAVTLVPVILGWRT